MTPALARIEQERMRRMEHDPAHLPAAAPNPEERVLAGPHSAIAASLILEAIGDGELAKAITDRHGDSLTFPRPPDPIAALALAGAFLASDLDRLLFQRDAGTPPPAPADPQPAARNPVTELLELGEAGQ